jgi:hypothetical protein
VIEVALPNVRVSRHLLSACAAKILPPNPDLPRNFSTVEQGKIKTAWPVKIFTAKK